jgi:hypothetical protein
LSCLRGVAGLFLLAGVATGCGDDGGVTVNDDTGGPTSTGEDPTTSPSTMTTTGVSMSTT